jgi:hypothetical protein
MKPNTSTKNFNNNKYRNELIIANGVFDDVKPLGPKCFDNEPTNILNQASKTKKIFAMLLGELWLQDETCILFSDNKIAKTIFALQTTKCMIKGINMPGFKCDIDEKKVLHLDFDFYDIQLEERYLITPENICKSIEQSLIKNDAKVLIIDNFNNLKYSNKEAPNSIQLLKQLISLKKKHSLSILILIHTPKRNPTKLITKNDLSESKTLLNFCDSCFAIGDSFQKRGLKYIKQIKQRNTELIYDSNNVIIYKIEKLLQFKFLSLEYETDHIKKETEENNDDLNTEIVE